MSAPVTAPAEPGSASRRPRALIAAALALAVLAAAVLAAALTRPDDDADGPRDDCGAARPKDGGGAWECTFVDEFDGAALDDDKWLAGDTSFSAFRSGLTCYDEDNVAVGDGVLRLTARDEGTPYTCRSPAGDYVTQYTGGHIATLDRFSQTYGRFEARARYPEARVPGIHSAFWMYPAETTYGGWPSSGEIDIAEWWSADPGLMLPSLHYYGSNTSVDSGWGCRVDDVSDFHLYAVEWTAEQISFSIDDRTCFERSWEPAAPFVAPQPFDHPFVIVLTTGVGEQAGTNAVSAATPLPAVLEVDHVKAWR